MPAVHSTSRPAFIGQASTQRRQAAQRLSVMGTPAGSGRSVKTVVSRTAAPNRADTYTAVLPIQPRPAWVAAILCENTPGSPQSSTGGSSWGPAIRLLD